MVGFADAVEYPGGMVDLVNKADKGEKTLQAARDWLLES